MPPRPATSVIGFGTYWMLAREDLRYQEDNLKFMRQASEAYDRMMRSDQKQMITLDQIEDRALEVGSKLERFLMGRRLVDAGLVPAGIVG